MSRIEFLSLADAERRSIAWPDVYFTPWYGAAAAVAERAEWELAWWGDPGPMVCPYLRRPIDPALSGEEGLFDVVSPYGYCGTWSPRERSLAEWKDFRNRLRDRLRQRGAVAEFQRLSAFVPGRERLLAADPELVGKHHNDTVSIDVTRGYERCWGEQQGRSRTKVRKAVRLGYVWVCRPVQPEDVAPDSDFRRLYAETMVRSGATGSFLFPDAYYEALRGLPEERLWIFTVHAADGRPGVAGLFFLWPPLVHVHLVGSEGWALRDGAGNLHYDGLIRWCCERPEVRLLHIGAGMRPGDGMERFKRGFGGNPLPFWVARSVIDPDRFERLVQARARQSGRTRDELEATGYFPAYRA